MLNLGTPHLATVILAVSLLAGCNKEAATDLKSETTDSPASPEKPAAPESAQAGIDSPAAQPVSSPAANAGGDVSVSGTEARAGDVSVKLPE